MKKQINLPILLAFVLTFLSLQSAAQCKLDRNYYELVWNEEFLNLNDWTNSTNWAPAYSWFQTSHAFLTPDPNQPGDNWLNLRAERLSSPIAIDKTTNLPPTTQSVPDNISTRYYKCGYVKSIKEIDPPLGQNGWNKGFRWGMMEIRCKLPNGNPRLRDMWPAFWTYNGQGEIDVFDGNVNDPHRQLHSGLINWQLAPDVNPTEWELYTGYCGGMPDFQCTKTYYLNDYVNYDNECYRAKTTVYPSCGGEKANSVVTNLGEWHVYTAVWTPQQITFFLDEREMYTYKFSQRVTVHDLNTFFEIALMADWDANKPDAATDATLLVDYVRLYKPKGFLNDKGARLQPEHYVFTPYKSTSEYVNYDIFTNSTAWLNAYTKVQTPYRSSIAPDPNNADRLYFGSSYPQGSMYTSVKTTGGSWATIQMNSQYGYSIPSTDMEIDGDVIAEPGGKIYYRGKDGRIQYRAWDPNNNYWFYDYVDNNWNTTANLVSTATGHMALAPDGLFYIGTDSKLHRWQHVNSNNYWTILPVPYNNSNDYIDGELVARQNSGYNNLFFRGSNGKLNAAWEDNSGWHKGICGNTANSYTENKVALVPGSICLDEWDVYFIGIDHKIHRYYNVGMGWQTDNNLLSYNYSGYDLARGGITYDKIRKQLLYFGDDGRLQYFKSDQNGNWIHGFIDDYWNTIEYMSNSWMGISNSLIMSGSKICYSGRSDLNYLDYNGALTDSRSRLLYFDYVPCERLDPSPNPNSWINLNRSINRQPSPEVHPFIKAEGVTQNRIEVFPNPSSGLYYIEAAGAKFCKVEVNDLQGRLILEKQINTSGTVDISEYANGTYIFKIITDNKVMIEKVQLVK